MRNKKEEGITLVALVITIIVLLILASVSISTLSGDNGILNRTVEAKISNSLGGLKEEIRLGDMDGMLNNDIVSDAKTEVLIQKGKVKRVVNEGRDGNYYIYYVIKENAYDKMNGLGKGNLGELKDVFIIDDKLNVKYIGKDGKEYGDKVEEKILSDDTKIKFYNENFGKYIYQISGLENNDELTFKWMKNQKELVIKDKNVDSLEDLIFFPNLEKLHIWNNANFKNLDGIENCKKLKSFLKWSTHVDDYSKLSECYNLNIISIHSGNQKNIDNFFDSIKNLNNIENLTIEYYPEVYNIDKIDELKSKDKIKKLQIARTFVKDISKIKNLKNLEELYLWNNKIENIDILKNFHKLSKIDLSNNDIKDIKSFENLKNLNRIILNNNQITDITPLYNCINLNYLDVNQNLFSGNRNEYLPEKLNKIDKIGENIYNNKGEIKLEKEKIFLFKTLKSVDLSNQNLTNLSIIKDYKDIEELNVSNNPNLDLKDEESKNILKNMKKLKKLIITNTAIKDISILNDSELNYLEAYGDNDFIDLSTIQNRLPYMQRILVNQKILDTISKCSTENIVTIPIWHNPEINYIPDLSKFNKLTYMDIRAVPLREYSFLLQIPNVKTLLWGRTDLSSKNLDFSNLKFLKYLSLTDSNLRSTDLKNLESLSGVKNIEIHLENNYIIDASSLLKLDSSCKISLSGNVNLSEESKKNLKEKFGDNVKI